MGVRRDRLRVYAGALAASYALIGALASVQHFFVLRQFRPEFFVVPFVAATVVGLLVGTVLWLRRGLNQQRRLFKEVADFAQEFAYVRGLDGSYRYVSPAVQALTGYPPERFYEHPNFMNELVHPEDRPRWDEHLQEIDVHGEPEELTFRIYRADGELRWVRHLCGPVFDEDGRRVGVRSTNIDVTDAIAAEERMRHLADFDPLTDLPNRRYATRYLEELIGWAGPRGEQFHILFMDLDRFKFVNDAHGHSVGDGLLRELAGRMHACCDGSAIFSRFGGDEFLVVVPPGVASAQAPDGLAQRLLALVEEPFHVQGMQFRVGASVGVAVFPRDGRDPDALIKNADAAMYQAKKAGLEFRVFSPELTRGISDVVRLETRLREAVASDQLLPHYQPVIDLGSGRVVGAEALARWPQADGSFIPPATFIPLAEETNRIHALGNQILTKAFRDVSAWRAQGLDLKVAVNVSARQFQDPAFCDRVARLLDSAGCEPQAVELELTESALLEDVEESCRKIEALRAVGLTVALDDFGTGFSSLGYLSRLPIDTLKLDRTFIARLVEDRRQRAVVQGILALARNLELRVVAEGIEDARHVAALQMMGCERVQGYYFSKPLPAPAFLEFVRQTPEHGYIARTEPG